MFGWSKWEKFRDRFRISMKGLTENEMAIALESIIAARAKNKTELVTFLEANIREEFGSYTSKEFQENRQAMRFYTLLQKIKKDFVDEENFS